MGRGCRIDRGCHHRWRDERLPAVETRPKDRIQRRRCRRDGARRGRGKLARGDGGPPRALRGAEGNARRGARPQAGGRAIGRHTRQPVGSGVARRQHDKGRDQGDSRTGEAATAHRSSLRTTIPATPFPSIPDGRGDRIQSGGASRSTGPAGGWAAGPTLLSQVAREAACSSEAGSQTRDAAQLAVRPRRRARGPIESPWTRIENTTTE